MIKVMTKKPTIFLLFFGIILLTQCKQKAIEVTPTITPLSDFESHDGSISITIHGGKAPYAINWSNGEADTMITGLSAGTYYLTITDAKNKMLLDTLVVSQPEWPVCVDADQNSYKTAVFGDQTWMVENLKTTHSADGKAIESMVYNNNDSNVAVYGRLYTWNEAMNDSVNEGVQGICPDGWHLPSDAEWTKLTKHLNTTDKVLDKTQEILSLSFAGFYNNEFNNIDESVSFWTSTRAHDNAWKRYFHKDLNTAFRYHEKPTNAISVRCIKNK